MHSGQLVLVYDTYNFQCIACDTIILHKLLSKKKFTCGIVFAFRHQDPKSFSCRISRLHSHFGPFQLENVIHQPKIQLTICNTSRIYTTERSAQFCIFKPKYHRFLEEITCRKQEKLQLLRIGRHFPIKLSRMKRLYFIGFRHRLF